MSRKLPRYVYAKKSGGLFFKHPKSGKLPMPSADADDFMASYHKLMSSVANNTLSLPIKPAHERHLGYSGASSVGALAKDYFASEPFERLHKRTGYMRRLYIERCLRTMLPEPMGDGQPAEFSMWHLDEITKDVARDLRGALVYEKGRGGPSLKKAGVLDNWRDTHIRAMRAMFAWAVDKPYKWREDKVTRRLNANPFQRLGKLDNEDKSHRPWEQAHFDKLMAYLQREKRWGDLLGAALMRYAFVRRSDAVRLGPAHIKNIAARGANRPKLALVFKEWKGSQSRTARRQNKERIVPILPQLQAIFDSTPEAMAHDTFVIARGNRYGRPLTSNHFGTRIHEQARIAGLDADLTCHGIRHFAANTMAQNGASAHLIAEWGGWCDIRNVVRYTKGVNKAKLMEAGAQFVV
jgi:integrase